MLRNWFLNGKIRQFVAFLEILPLQIKTKNYNDTTDFCDNFYLIVAEYLSYSFWYWCFSCSNSLKYQNNLSRMCIVNIHVALVGPGFCKIIFWMKLRIENSVSEVLSNWNLKYWAREQIIFLTFRAWLSISASALWPNNFCCHK